VPGTELHLPTVNVEDTDGAQGSRRPSRLTVELGDETCIDDVVELAAAALQQLEPEVTDTQLAEVWPNSVIYYLLTSAQSAAFRTRYFSRYLNRNGK